MSTPRDRIEAKLGLTGPPLRFVRDSPPTIPDHELIRRIGQGAYGEVWLARNALGTWRAVKIVYRDNFKDARPYEREFAGIRRFEPLSRSNEGFVDVLQVGRFDPPRTDEPEGRAPRVPNNAPNQRADLRASPISEPENLGGWFYYVMELADAADAISGEMSSASPHTPDPAISDFQLSESGTLGTRPSDDYVPRTLARDLHHRGRLPLEDCLQLGLTLSLALGHLHRHGLIHRDVKPPNIIFVGGVPKLADIGLVTEASGANTFVGTEGFIPPEGPTSPQADIYALGKVLYEAAMGKDRNEFPEPFTQISTGRESVALMELNVVLLRACAPDPKKRYASAEEMHADLALLHSGGSVKRRHQFDRQFRIAKQVGAVAITATLLIGAAWFWQQQQTGKMTRLVAEKSELADTNARLASDQSAAASESQRRLIQMQTVNGLRAMDEGDPASATLWFAGALKHSEGDAEGQRRQRDRLAALFSHLPKPIAMLSLVHDGINAKASPDGQRIIGVGRSRNDGLGTGEIKIWEASSLRLLHSLTISNIWGGAFTSRSGRWAIVSEQARKRIWDVAAGVPVSSRVEAEGVGGTSAWSPDETRIATVQHEGTNVYLLEAPSGRALAPPLQHSNRVVLITFDPTGRWLATGTEVKNNATNPPTLQSRPLKARTGQARVWDATTGKPVTDWIDADDPVSGLTFSPDGSAVAISGFGGVSTGSGFFPNLVNVIELPSGKHRFPALTHPDSVVAAVFSPDGRHLATGSADRIVTIWNAHTGEPVHPALKHGNTDYRLRFSPDGLWLAAGGEVEVRLWEVRSGTPMGPPLKHGEDVFNFDFTPDGGRLITTTTSGKIRVWDLAGAESALPPFAAEGGNALTSAVFSPDGRQLVTVGVWGDFRVWDVQSGLPLGETLFGTNKLVIRRGLIGNQAAWSPDGNSLAVPSGDNTVRVWDVATGKERLPPLRHPELVLSTEFSPDGRRLVTASKDFTARIWDSSTGAQLTPRLQHSNVVGRARFSPDGRRIVTASSDGTARVWDAATGASVSPPLEHGGWVEDVAFSPDGNRVAVGGNPGKATIRDAVTGQQLGGTMQHSAPVLRVCFSPDGRRILTTSMDRTARVWDADTGEPVTPPLVHDGYVVAGDFSPDGRRVITGSYDGTARVWDTATGEPLSPSLKHEKAVLSASISPDGRSVVTSSMDGTAQIWETPALNWSDDEITAAARVLVGAGLGNSERVETLTASQLDDAWGKVSSRLQIKASGSATAAGLWHRRRMLFGERVQDWFAAEFHARRLLELRPDDEAVRTDLARVKDHRPPAREPGTPPALIDLSAFYNASLAIPWHPGPAGNHLAELPRGIQTLAGTRFDVRGLVQVEGHSGSPWLHPYPVAVTGLPIKRKAVRLQILHSIQGFQPPDGTRVGHYLVHFANGRREEIPIIYGRDARDWWEHPNVPVGVTGAVIAWKGSSPATKQTGMPGIRLFKRTWENPAPEVEITKVDFVAEHDRAHPFLVALTAE